MLALLAVFAFPGFALAKWALYAVTALVVAIAVLAGLSDDAP